MVHLSDGKAACRQARISQNVCSRYLPVQTIRTRIGMLSGSIRRKVLQNLLKINVGLISGLSGGACISNCAFMENVTWVDDLKIRSGLRRDW